MKTGVGHAVVVFLNLKIRILRILSTAAYRQFSYIHSYIHTYITYSHYYRRGWNQLSLQLQDKYFGDTKSRQIFYSAIHCPE